MSKSPYLLINRLVVKGPTNTYLFEFVEGVNLIWGDMDCGKSSILNLIDYCLGGKNDRLMFAEMKRHARTAFLEVDLNGTICTLERDIHSPSSPVRVYLNKFKDITDTFPKWMAASSQDEKAPDGWLSNFILNTLGIPQVSIKESRTREDSSSDRLSFRDLMKLMYLKQTKMGAESFLDNGNGAVFNKNVEIQKFVYNIYDEQLTQLYKDLGEASTQLNVMQQRESSIRKFLDEVQVERSSLDDARTRMEFAQSTVDEINNQIERLKSDFDFANDITIEIRSAIKQMHRRISEISSKREKLGNDYNNFARLRNTYSYDIETLRTTALAYNFLGGAHPESTVPCPLCTQDVQISDVPEISRDEVAFLAKSTENRLAGVNEVLADLRNKQSLLSTEEREIEGQLSEAQRSFDENNITALSPLVSSIQTLEAGKTASLNELSELSKNFKISNKYTESVNEIEIQQILIIRIKDSIKLVEEGLLGIESVLEKLSANLYHYLKRSGLQNIFGLSIDKRFVPWFREISYFNTPSGGVRTILSIGAYLIRLQYLLAHNTNLPSFLMIDTPGQNIGRHRDSNDTSDISDPQLYENIFAQLLLVCNEARQHRQSCQIIVVDNDFPESFTSEPNLNVVRQFSKRAGSEKGLFWDA